ncbi:hypothetical protein AVEN_55866-1 [Araneus ventricosus]|uniref:Uncharacterized protein n=1 Tax=Araneus ventricosus TaxID=182803 RepID=A0A4Y2GSM1_ARAVE|nr:hypothetical protein AVEN_55866-1 [Araneus ventricosus]
MCKMSYGHEHDPGLLVQPGRDDPRGRNERGRALPVPGGRGEGVLRALAGRQGRASPANGLHERATPRAGERVPRQEVPLPHRKIADSARPQTQRGSSENLVPEPPGQVEAREGRARVGPGRFEHRRQRAQNRRSYPGAREPHGHQEPAPADREDTGQVRDRPPRNFLQPTDSLSLQRTPQNPSASGEYCDGVSKVKRTLIFAKNTSVPT